jgi:anaerobic magnesium-protoporphyrin IX monomethyl ester cyclase
MHILFAIPPVQLGNKVWAYYPPLGIMYMSALLKREGHRVSYIDGILEDLDGPAFAQAVRALRPDLVGIGVNAYQMKHCREYTQQLRASAPPRIPVVIGGPFVTSVGKAIFNSVPGIDFAVSGEGEHAMLDLVRYLEGWGAIGQVRNLIFKQDGLVRQNPVMRIADIERLPLPDYDLVDRYIQDYPGAHPSIARPTFDIMCTRGCPFACKFCSSPTLWHRRVAFRSVDSVVEEAGMLVRRYGAREIFFQDDTLNARKEWFTELCDRLISTGLSRAACFKAQFRVNEHMVTEDILKKARDANFWMIFYGVESGNQAMLDSMQKGITVAEIERAFRLTAEAGIKSLASFIVGFPGETVLSIKDSFELVTRIRPDFGGFAVAVPFPGSKLYDEAVAGGLLDADSCDLASYNALDCKLRTPELSHPELVNYATVGVNLLLEAAAARDARGEAEGP